MLDFPLSPAEGARLLLAYMRMRRSEFCTCACILCGGTEDESTCTCEVLREAGGPGSGNFGHSGRPGEVGGSSDSTFTSGDKTDVLSDPATETRPRGTVVAKSKYGQVEVQNPATDSQRARYIGRRKNGEAVGTATTVKGVMDILRKPKNTDAYQSGYMSPDVQWKVLGGPGSGNFGHSGRPGEVGGSDASGISSIEVSESVLNSLPVEAKDRLVFVTRSLSTTAKQMDFPLEKIHVVPSDRKFVVGGRTFTEAAHFNPSSGEIVFNANTLAQISDINEAREILAHEVTHRDWHVVSGKLGLEEGRDPEIDLSTVPPSADRVMEILSEGGSILEREDGVTDYSRAYWRDVPKEPRIVATDDPEAPWMNADTGEMFEKKPDTSNWQGDNYDQKFNTAVNETLAEIRRIDMQRSYGVYPDGKSTFDPTRTWRELANNVKIAAKEFRKREEEHFQKVTRGLID